MFTPASTPGCPAAIGLCHPTVREVVAEVLQVVEVRAPAPLAQCVVPVVHARVPSHLRSPFRFASGDAVAGAHDRRVQRDAGRLAVRCEGGERLIVLDRIPHQALDA